MYVSVSRGGRYVSVRGRFVCISWIYLWMFPLPLDNLAVFSFFIVSSGGPVGFGYGSSNGGAETEVVDAADTTLFRIRVFILCFAGSVPSLPIPNLVYQRPTQVCEEAIVQRFSCRMQLVLACPDQSRNGQVVQQLSSTLFFYQKL